MAERSSHEGHMPGKAGAHLKKMHKEHGHPDHQRVHGRPSGPGGDQSSPRENMRTERMDERMEREDD